MKRLPVLPGAIVAVAVALFATVGPALMLPESVLPAAAQSDDPAVPSPSPLPALGAVARPGGIYVGTMATGAPVRIEISADGSSIAWYELGDYDFVVSTVPTIAETVKLLGRKIPVQIYAKSEVIAASKSVPVITWDRSCGSVIQGDDAIWLAADAKVPIVDGRLTKRTGTFLIEGEIDGNTASGTYSISGRDDPKCDASTAWTASVVP